MKRNVRYFNKEDKAWYVPYRLISREVDNYKTYIDPAGCQNILGRTFKNIGVDTSHNLMETAGAVEDMYNEIDDRVGLTLNIMVRYGEDDYLTDANQKRITKGLNGEEIRSSAHAYELGYIKGVSIDFHPIETYITETNRKGWRTYSANRVAVLTKLTGDVPGQGMSGELQGAEYRTQNKQVNDSTSIIGVEFEYKDMPKNLRLLRCLCDLTVGAFARSIIDNQYIEILKIDGEGDNKSFTLRNVLTGDEFVTTNDDHFNEVTPEDVTIRIEELLKKTEATRTFDEKDFNEMRACLSCQEKMAKRKEDLIKKSKETKAKAGLVTARAGDSLLDLPIIGDDKMPNDDAPLGMEEMQANFNTLKSQVESLQSQVDTLMSDMEVIKGKENRSAEEAELAKDTVLPVIPPVADKEIEEEERIKKAVERMLSSKKPEEKASDIPKVNTVNEEIKKMNEAVARAYNIKQ